MYEVVLDFFKDADQLLLQETKELYQFVIYGLLFLVFIQMFDKMLIQKGSNLL